MALGFSTTLRNNMLDEITALIDAGTTGGFIRIYDGTQPSNGGAVTTLLAELQFSTTSFPAASGASMQANSITDETAAPAAGTATWFRVVDDTGAFVIDGTVGTSGADLNLSNTSIAINDTVSIGTNFTLSAGNAGV